MKEHESWISVNSEPVYHIRCSLEKLKEAGWGYRSERERKDVMSFMKDKMMAFMLGLGENQWDDSPTRVNARGGRYKATLGTDKRVWREITERAVEYGFNTVFIAAVDGLRYKSHPEIAVEGAWEVDELKEELHRLRELGLTPIPELNFSTAHDIWLGEYSRMVSTPIYYQVVRDLIHELIDIFDKPEFFMMDHDEENHLIQRRMDFVCYRQFDLYWHDMLYIQDCIREKGVRPWMYCDSYVHHPEEFAKYVLKDVVVSPWYYGNFYSDASLGLPQPNSDPDHYNEFILGKIACFTGLPKLGYDIIPVCSNTSNDFNIYHTIRYIAENVPKEKLLGVGIAPWAKTVESSKYTFLNAFEQAKDAIDRYCK